MTTSVNNIWFKPKSNPLLGWTPLAWQGWFILLGYMWYVIYNVMSMIYTVNFFVSISALYFQFFAIGVNLVIGTAALYLIIVLSSSRK